MRGKVLTFGRCINSYSRADSNDLGKGGKSELKTKIIPQIETTCSSSCGGRVNFEENHETTRKKSGALKNEECYAGNEIQNGKDI